MNQIVPIRCTVAAVHVVLKGRICLHHSLDLGRHSVALLVLRGGASDKSRHFYSGMRKEQEWPFFSHLQLFAQKCLRRSLQELLIRKFSKNLRWKFPQFFSSPTIPSYQQNETSCVCPYIDHFAFERRKEMIPWICAYERSLENKTQF